MNKQIRERIEREDDRIAQRYPGDERTGERHAAMAAVPKYLDGMVTLESAAKELARARRAEARALAVALQVGAMAIADGVSEAEVARQLGVTRKTLRRGLGKASA